MTLFELTPVDGSALPIAALKDHLRLGTGFADDAEQDGVLEAALRAALSAIEARTGKAIFARRFSWSVLAWREAGRAVLPLAPVSGIVSLTVLDVAGEASLIDADRYYLAADDHAPALASAGLTLPTIPTGGRADMVFDAGLSAEWSGIPGDMAQAVLMLAADFYEHRGEAGSDGMPPRIAALLEPYRAVRLFGRGV